MKSNDIIRRMAHTPTGLHVREAGEGEAPSRVITGYAILFDTPSAVLYEDDLEEVREVIAPEAVTIDLLNRSDIKMTMFHDNHLLLARSRNGEGTLTYGIDEKGVCFEFEAPRTVDGDKALELVSRGEMSGCSFAFSTFYFNSDYVSVESKAEGDKKCTTYTVREITGIYDFTLTPDPAYPDTHCETETRALVNALRQPVETENKPSEKMREQVQEMRRAASRPIV